MSTSPYLESIRNHIRLNGFSLRTEKSYLFWIKRFILFSGKRHPEQMGDNEVIQFLTWLSAEKHVAINTQKVALNAIVFLYKQIVKRELGELGFRRASKQRRLPIVLSPSEIAKILDVIKPKYRIIIQLLYGSGLRVIVVKFFWRVIKPLFSVHLLSELVLNNRSLNANVRNCKT